MSFQEEKLTAIADAIREKDGTTEPILANDFAARILAIKAGSDFAIPLVVSTGAGALITAVNGDITIDGTADEDGNATLILTAPGEWTVTASLDGHTNMANVTVDNGYSLEIALGSRLPAGYTEVEYIQSNGAQYIDTEIKATKALEVRVDVSVLSLSPTSTTFFGTFGSGSAGTGTVQFRALTAQTNTLRFLIHGATINKVLTVGRHLIGIDALSQSVIYDSSITKYSPGNNLYNNLPVYLFAYNSYGNVSGGSSIKMYSCQMIDNGVLVRDFVPCINSAGEAGLYDMIESKFYGNLGANEFTAGPAV